MSPARQGRGRTLEGVGVGLRYEFAGDLIETTRQVDWLEIVPENWLGVGGVYRRLLDRYAERWLLVPHSISLSIGGPDPFDEDFLTAMARLCHELAPPFWSDHICYARLGGTYMNDLLPLPFTEEAVDHTVTRLAEVQRRSEVPLVLENATFYAHMPDCTMDEAEFINAILDRSGCGMLLDVNNVYVNSQNHGFDACAFIDRMPLDKVRQLHLAGHTLDRDVIIDTHRGPIIDPVWDLYRYTLQRAGRMIPTLIEWDSEIPPVDQVLDEVDRARSHARDALAAPVRKAS